MKRVDKHGDKKSDRKSEKKTKRNLPKSFVGKEYSAEIVDWYNRDVRKKRGSYAHGGNLIDLNTEERWRTVELQFQRSEEYCRKSSWVCIGEISETEKNIAMTKKWKRFGSDRSQQKKAIFKVLVDSKKNRHHLFLLTVWNLKLEFLLPSKKDR